MLLKSNLTLILLSLFAISTLAVLAPGEKAIPIPKDEKGFYFETNIGNKTHPNIARLVPSFSSDISFFSKSCAGFKPYDCSSCEIDINEFDLPTRELPSLSGSYYFLNPKAEMSTTFWGLNRKVWRANCEIEGLDFEQKRSGLLGMGYSWSFIPFNFPKAFTVLVNKEQNKSALFYGEPPSVERTPLFTLKSGKNWRTYGYGRMTSFEKCNLGAEIYFDLNAKALGFESSLYSKIQSGIMKAMGCKDAKETDFKPKCSFEGKIETLPSINFEFSEGDLSIPPAVYIDSISEGIATLNIKRISDYMSGERIVLDAKFMSHHEVVFDMSNREKFAMKIYSLEGTTLSVDDAKEEVPEPPKKEDEKEPPKKEEEKEPKKEEPKKEEPKKEEPKKEEPKKEEPKKEEDKKEPPKNTDKENVERSSFSFGSFFSGLLLALLLSGVVFGYLRYKDNKKNAYASLNDSHTEMRL